MSPDDSQSSLLSRVEMLSIAIAIASDQFANRALPTGDDTARIAFAHQKRQEWLSAAFKVHHETLVQN